MVLVRSLIVLTKTAILLPLYKQAVALDMTTTRWFLDNIESLHGEEGDTYPDDQFSRIQTCLARFSSNDLDLQAIAEKTFSGILTYGISGGALDGSDPWFKDPIDGSWLEYDPFPLTSDTTTYPGAEDVIIYEPCNYASNVAYYRAALELCERNDSNDVDDYDTGVFQALTTLMPGSAFYHASSTSLGGTLDELPIEILSLLHLQKLISKYPFDPLTHNFERPGQPSRNSTGLESVDELVTVLNNTNVHEWSEAFRTIEKFGYTLGFTCTVVVMLEIIFQGDPEVAELIFQVLVPIAPIEDNDVEFFVSTYQPAIREMLLDITLSGSEKALIANKFIGAAIKIFYAFYWQEEAILGDHLTSEQANINAAELIPKLIRLANSISGYRYVDNDLQSAIDAYPGDVACRQSQPHSKWHEMSGLALIDISLLVGDVDSILRNPANDGSTIEFGLLYCLIVNDCLEGFPDDFGGVIDCLLYIPFLNPRPACEDKADAGLILCLPLCGEDVMCYLDCFIEYADIGYTVIPPECVDSPLNVGNSGKGCTEVEDEQDICEVQPRVASHCPLSCNKCPDFACADSTLPFEYGNTVTNCSNLASLTEPLIETACEIEEIYSTCRETCRFCDQ